MCAALSVVIMLLAGVIPTMTIALPAIAGCVLIAVTVELSEKFAFLVYAVVAVISFFITADKEAMLMYVLLFGYYPVLYSVLGKIKNKVVSYLIKLLVFNAAAIADFFIVTFIFSIPMGIVTEWGEWALPLLLLVANVIFIFYDSLLMGIVHFYYTSLHPTAKKFLKK